MKPNTIDYFQDCPDETSLLIGARDEKMKLLMNFLIKTDFKFEIEQFDDGKAISFWNSKDKKVTIDFCDQGGIRIAEAEEDQE